MRTLYLKWNEFDYPKNDKTTLSNSNHKNLSDIILKLLKVIISVYGGYYTIFTLELFIKLGLCNRKSISSVSYCKYYRFVTFFDLTIAVLC